MTLDVEADLIVALTSKKKTVRAKAVLELLQLTSTAAARALLELEWVEADSKIFATIANHRSPALAQAAVDVLGALFKDHDPMQVWSSQLHPTKPCHRVAALVSRLQGIDATSIEKVGLWPALDLVAMTANDSHADNLKTQLVVNFHRRSVINVSVRDLSLGEPGKAEQARTALYVLFHLDAPAAMAAARAFIGGLSNDTHLAAATFLQSGFSPPPVPEWYLLMTEIFEGAPSLRGGIARRLLDLYQPWPTDREQKLSLVAADRWKPVFHAILLIDDRKSEFLTSEELAAFAPLTTS